MEKTCVKEVVLSRRPPKNPVPSMNSGGDCGACVLAGVLGIEIKDAYELHCSGEYYGGKEIPKVSSFNFHSMVRTLKNLVDDLDMRKENKFPPAPLMHTLTHIPLFPFDEPHTLCGVAFGLTGGMQFSGWCDYVRAMLTGGYYGIAQVWDGGYKGDLKQYGMTNHWIMICGWRYVYVKHETGAALGHYEQEVLIGNSSNACPQEEWISAGNFLKFWGGFGVLWAKPATN